MSEHAKSATGRPGKIPSYPLVAGSGARLFRDGRAIKHLQLADSKITENGVAIFTYKPSQSTG